MSPDGAVKAPTDAFRLDGRTVVLTGATGGIGRQFVSALDAVGARLVLAGRDQGALDRLAGECHDAIGVACDMVSESAVDALAGTALECFGHVDVLVNNAGAATSARAVDEPMDEVRRLLEVDLVSAYRLSQLLAPSMIERGGGSVVNVASMSGTRGNGRLPLAGYAAAKGGLVSLTRELAAQWGRHGIRVNAIAPGYIATGMSTWADEDPKAIEWIKNRTPLRRIGRGGEVDGALLFLAGSASSYVTGAVIPVDGGWTAT